MLKPCLGAFQRDRLIVDGKLIDKELVPEHEVWKISNAKNTHSTFPDTVTLDQRIPLGVDGKERLLVWFTCITQQYVERANTV